MADLSKATRPFVELADGTRDYRQPTDTVVIVAFFGTDVAGAEYLMADGRFSRERDGTAAAEFVRPDAEAKIRELQPTMRQGLHLWVVRTEWDASDV